MRALLFGTGEYAKKILPLAEQDYEIIGFLDNDSTKWTSCFCTKPVYNPSDIHKITFDKIIIASIGYAMEMFYQLLQIGIREHDIVIEYISKKKYIYLYDLFGMQFDINGNMKRVDIAVKYYAIDSFMHLRQDGIEFYIDMQKKRLGIDDDAAREMWHCFRNLIESVKENGFDDSSYIVCGKNLLVMDGAHRIAVALYFGIESLPVKIVPQEYVCNYGMDWFLKQGVTNYQLELLKNLVKYLRNKRRGFWGIIWPPAINICNEIENDIMTFVNSYESKILDFRGNDIKAFVESVYSVDDIEMWKILEKEKHISGYGNMVKVLRFDIENPRFRLKDGSGLPISQEVERIKSFVRLKYKDRILDYYHDNILHITDNFYQTKLIEKIMNVSRDITEIFLKMEVESYVMLKYDVPYMPKDFPKVYPMNKDVDIFCPETVFAFFVQILGDFSEKYIKANGLRIKRVEEDYRCKIRLEYLGFLMLQFDISCHLYNLKSDFAEEMLMNREKRGVCYVPREQDEIAIRINELVQFPNKFWHKDYLRNKREKIDKERLKEALVNCEKVESVIDSL